MDLAVWRGPTGKANQSKAVSLLFPQEESRGGMDGAAIPAQLRVGLVAEGGCRSDLPHVQGVSITPGALSAWHGGSVDFSPGDSEIIAGLWQAHPAQPLSGLFCCFIFANIAMPLVLPPRTGTAVPPRLLSPPPPCHWGTKHRQSRARKDTRSLLFSAEHGFGRRFCTSKASPVSVTYFPMLTLHHVQPARQA